MSKAKPIVDIRAIERNDLEIPRSGYWQDMEVRECGEWMRSADVIAFIEKMGFRVFAAEQQNYSQDWNCDADTGKIEFIGE